MKVQVTIEVVLGDDIHPDTASAYIDYGLSEVASKVSGLKSWQIVKTATEEDN